MKRITLGFVALGLIWLPGCGGGTKKAEKSNGPQVAFDRSPEDEGTKVSFFGDNVQAFDDIESYVLEDDAGAHMKVAHGDQDQATPFTVADTVLPDEHEVLYFEYGTRELRQDQKDKMRSIEKKVEKWVKQGRQVVFKGHACQLGQAGDLWNVALSAERAQDMATLCCPDVKDNIKVFGVGRAEARTDERTEEAQAGNRRVEIYPIVV